MFYEEIFMKHRTWLLAFPILFACSSITFAQGAKSSERPTVSQVEDGLVCRVERTFVRTAAAMPEDKFSFAPTNGEFKCVRTFVWMLKHESASTYGIAPAILQEIIPAKC